MPADEEVVRDLFTEYLSWVCSRICEEYEIVFDAGGIVAHDMETIDAFLPPKGLLLVSYDEGLPTGCACTRTIADRTAELKRMYVRPAHRNKGIGTRLVNESIAWARAMSYSRVRLDSAGFMSDAHRVYRRLGFHDISAYEGTEIPKQYQAHWVFMELELTFGSA